VLYCAHLECTGFMTGLRQSLDPELLSIADGVTCGGVLGEIVSLLCTLVSSFVK
jgi:hypothetical protein